ncbi:hypothetical protein [Halorhabdus sp. CBA1104]|uniref:hypothetical protein n=2 Tax=unclassified Halorhabdus TaxID=2621901 RepID=UPI0018A6CC8C|nr:hypothetical protein [Halorhabdus sp. CBA1104]
MDTYLYRASLFVLYQLTLLVGILLLPVALLARRVGFTLPLDRLVTRLGNAYDRTADGS